MKRQNAFVIMATVAFVLTLTVGLSQAQNDPLSQAAQATTPHPQAAAGEPLGSRFTYQGQLKKAASPSAITARWPFACTTPPARAA